MPDVPAPSSPSPGDPSTRLAPTSDPSAATRVRVAVLEAYFADREAGRTPTLASLLERFPATHHALVVEEYVEAEGAGAVFAELWRTDGSARAPGGRLAFDRATIDRRGVPPLGGLPERGGRGDTNEASSTLPAKTAEGEVATSLASVAHYRLRAELGRGGQGTVYLADDTKLGRPVALKVLHAGRVGDRAGLERFRREAALAAKLDHEAIAAVYEAGQDGDLAYIAMRPVDGEPWSTLIARQREAKRPPPLALPGDEDAPPRRRAEAAVRKAAKLARALASAHEAGIVHRDVKPGNVMIARDGSPVLLDFGLARSDEERLFETRTGELLGTPAYMAPEQIRGGRAAPLDGRVDVYALGATLYEALTLERPFAGDGAGAMVRAILDDSLADPRKRCRAIDADLAAILETALEKDLARRYATAGDFADDLDAWLEHRPIDSRRPGLLGRFLRWMRRRPVHAALLVCAVLGVPTLASLAAYAVATRDDVALAKRQRHDQALESLLSRLFFAGAAPELTSLAEEALELDPDSAEARAALAFAAWRTEREHEALAILDADGALLERHAGLRRARAAMASMLAGHGFPNDPPERLTTTTDFALEALTRSHVGRRTERAEQARIAKAFQDAMLRSPVARSFFVVNAARTATLAGDYDVAERLARVARHLWPESPFTWFVTGFNAFRTRRLGDAEAACKRALELDPRLDVARTTLLATLLTATDYDAAVAAAKAFVQFRPDAPSAAYWLVRTTTLLDPGDGVAVGREMARRFPDSSAVLGALAEAERCAGLQDDAIATATKAAALSTEPDSRIQGTLSRAMIAVGREDDAVASWRRHLESNPEDATARSDLATHLGERKRFEEAAGLFEEATRLEPYAIEHFENLARTYRSLQRWTDAEATARKALALSKTSASASLTLAVALEKRGRKDEALAAARAAREAGAWSPELVQLEASYLNAAGRPAEAVDLLLDAVKRGSTTPATWVFLGRFLTTSGDPERGLAALTKGRALAPHGSSLSTQAGSWAQDAEDRLRRFRRIDEVLRAATIPVLAKELFELAGEASRAGRPDLVLALLAPIVGEAPRFGVNIDVVLRAAQHLVYAAARAHELRAVDPSLLAGTLALSRRWLEDELTRLEQGIADGSFRAAGVARRVDAWTGDEYLKPLGADSPLPSPAERAAWKALFERIERLVEEGS